MSDDIKLGPQCAPCFNFLRGNTEAKVTAWLVPRIVQRRSDKLVISWGCNWGHVCQSDCIYAHRE